jgi:Solitary outer membrane autotransporter beta-barrel domain
MTGRVIFRVGSLTAPAFLLIALLPCVARAQITQAQANEIRAGIENRIEALTILGGDFGLSDGSFQSDGRQQPGRASTHIESDVTKGGGSGDVGDPMPIGNLPLGWQPRLQGSFGYLSSENLPREGIRANDRSVFRTYALEFGMGARVWFSDRFSVAPTMSGLFGHTANDYTANSAFVKANQALATQLGLINWSIVTWTLRPAINAQYLINWKRSIITLSSDITYFYTEDFGSSNPNVHISGDSGSLTNKIDVDIPLGIELGHHELRTGGYLSRTELYADLRQGLGVDHMNEVHGRLVMDVLNQFWKVQWIGVGASYVWGPNIMGWSVGADVAFRF